MSDLKYIKTNDVEFLKDMFLEIANGERTPDDAIEFLDSAIDSHVNDAIANGDDKENQSNDISQHVSKLLIAFCEYADIVGIGAHPDDVKVDIENFIKKAIYSC